MRLMIWRLIILTILLGSAATIQIDTAATAAPGPIYALPILAASAVHARRGALPVAVLSMLLYAGTAAGQR